VLTIVGGGRIGSALASVAAAEGVEHLLMDRGGDDTLLREGAGPIVVCTRNDDAAGVVARCERRADMVFVQNGAFLPWAESQGLGQSTFGLLYFAVPSAGATPEPGGETVFFGPHALGLVYLLRRAQIPARALDSPEELRREVAVKLIWAAIFGLLGDLHRETVLASCARSTEVRALVDELSPVCDAGLGTTLDPEVVTGRLLAYSHAIGSWRASVKEWRWRNGWLVDTALASGRACPRHDQLLTAWRGRTELRESGGVY
jgi:hypothetical protein